MENMVAVKNDTTFTNVPANLNGIAMGDKLVISKLSKSHENPDYAKYMLGIKFEVDELVQLTMAAGCEFLFVLDGDCFENAKTDVKQRVIDAGFKGSFDDVHMFVYPDMVEFVDKKNEDKTEKFDAPASIYIAPKDRKEEIMEEMISKVDKETIKNMIMAYVGRFDKDKTPETIEWFLHEWAKAKYEYYLAFGRKLSIMTDISYQMNAEEMAPVVENLCREYPKYAASLLRVDCKGYVENRMGRDELFEKYSGIKPNGMKVSKFFSQLFKDEAFDIALSKVMQEREIKGGVYISIDPRDYLTASENKNKWHSCFAPGGVYANGPFAYALDESTLIVYRSNGKMYNYVHGKWSYDWNSKSWRQFCHFDKKTCTAIFSREYPNNTKVEEVCEKSRALLEKTISEYLGIDDNWDNYGDVRNLYENGINGVKIYKDIGSSHYSDISHFESLRREYTIKKSIIIPHNRDIAKANIEAGVKTLRCFVCGRESKSVNCGNH